MINNLPINICEHLGDRTYQIDNVGMSNANVMFYEDLVLKIEESTAEAQREHQMYQWLQGQLPLPNIVKAMEHEEHHYLLMEKLKGEYACSDFWLKQPESLVEMLVQALQMIWNISIEHCPYDATLSQKLKHAEYNVDHGLCDMDDAEADAKSLAVILQGSDCNSIYNNQFVLDNFADLLPETETLLVEKYGITHQLPYVKDERKDCPKEYLDNDSIAQRVQDYVQVLDKLKDHYQNIYLIGGSESAVVAALLSEKLDYIDATIAMNGGGQYFLDDIYYFIEKSVPAEYHVEAKASFKESLQAVLDGKSEDYLSEHGKQWWQSVTQIDFQQTLENSQNQILVIQTLNDDNVNWQGAIDMSKRIQSNKVKFRFIDGQNHYFENEQGERSIEDLRTIIQDWLKQVL